MPISDQFAMQRRVTLRWLPAVAVVLVAVALVPVAQAQTRAAAKPTFTSPDAAYEQGVGALRSGYVELAIPALEFAANRNVFLAQFYLARTLSDSGTSYTDHAAAYKLYQRIATEHADIDPDDDRRAPFVAKSFTALAAYVKDGIESIGLRPDPARAAELLKHAAQFFNNEDAQFQLARLYLDGEGVSQDSRAGLHWISGLASRGHAAAQAFLADIYWRGRYGVKQDQERAFALISVAAENAPDSERVWIDDIYQLIFCGASPGVRTQSQGMVADWRQKYGRAVAQTERGNGLGALTPRAARTCSNGETVVPLANTATSRDRPSVLQGGMMGIGTSRAQGR